MKRVLIIGAAGQIGSELAGALRERYGNNNVIASDIKVNPDNISTDEGIYRVVDCTDGKAVSDIVKKWDVHIIYHLAAVLSAAAEENPQLAWHINMTGLLNVLQVAREHKCQVFHPSSIGVFGSTTPPNNTPQDTIQRPTTLYGITKVAGELLCDYYFNRFGVDTRGVRYPGIMSHRTLPGGGTTDYAAEIYYAAVRRKKYTCYLSKGTYLDMMYIPDAIRAAIDLMEADSSKLKHRNSYNVTAMSVCPDDIAAEIRTLVPEFAMTYEIDPIRQDIADSWPNSIDDNCAREEWGWQPKYDLQSMTKEMVETLTRRYRK